MNINKNFVALFQVETNNQKKQLKKNSNKRIPSLQKKPDSIEAYKTLSGSIDNGSDSIDNGSDVVVWERSGSVIDYEKFFVSIIDLLSEDANKADPFSLIKNIGIEDFYIFKYKNAVFFLITGKTIILNGWNLKIKEFLCNFINQVESVDLIDHTYAEEENSRRLHSLGGGLRRILTFSKKIEKENKSLIDISALTPPKVVLKGGKEDTSIKTKTILNNLKYETLLGDKGKLIKQLFAVEKNTKVNLEVKSENGDSTEFNILAITQITLVNLYGKNIIYSLEKESKFNNQINENLINFIKSTLEQLSNNLNQNFESYRQTVYK